MSEVSQIEVVDGVGIITIDSPPVNALGINVRRALDGGFKQLADDKEVKAIVLICDGRTFFAGADISELGKPLEEPGLVAVFDIIENGEKPVIAAIHGTALGGGLELALICHYRVAVPSAQAGLPEVNLGLLPGAGGTQRLPRLVGAEVALDLITSGRAISASKAVELGVFDALAKEESLRNDSIDFAKAVLAEKRPLLRVRDRKDKIEPARSTPELFDTFRTKKARAFRGFKAPESIIKCIEAAVHLPFEQGIAREAELFQELNASTESAAQRNYFFAERQTAKIPDIPRDTPVLPIKSVGVIGAGTMGGGITMNFLNVGVPVTIIETSQEALDRGLGVIRSNYERSAKKGKLTPQIIEDRMALITPGLNLAQLADVDLVIEAVFESMDVKKDVFSRLDGIVKEGAILATNTSFLDINEIAAITRRPESVVGLHFFSPANVMRLLEVVRGDATSKAVVATAMSLAKKIGKVPVLSGVCDGFIANRLMRPRGVQADHLVLEGPTPQDIDNALYDYGFAMGPFQMIDLVGLDVLGRDSDARTLRGDFVTHDRLGQKKNGGFYDYDENRKPTPSPAAAKIIEEFAAFNGIEKKGLLSAEDIVARLLYPVVNEGAKILEEGIALRASDIDVAAILGYNWPVYKGGPMFWAETVGLSKIVDGLGRFEAETGDEAFRPATLLVDLADSGKTFADTI
ncbi:MAG: 3-hydroxyacyl-CoA dehydrogenase NAD-binding domain-containing protein [Pseudomonadota bacterium]